jgi:hypothetical protein
MANAVEKDPFYLRCVPGTTYKIAVLLTHARHGIPSTDTSEHQNTISLDTAYLTIYPVNTVRVTRVCMVTSFWNSNILKVSSKPSRLLDRRAPAPLG